MLVTFKDKEYFTNLSDELIEKTLKKYKESAYSFLDNIFGDKQRLTFDVDILQKFDKTSDELYGANSDYMIVREFLANNGYIITDYDKGVCKKDPNREHQIDVREYKIGRILQRFNASDEIKKQFTNGETRACIKQSKSTLNITISRLPFDVVSMSYKRGWTSCMEAGHGANRHFIWNDIEKGTCIAYLHTKTDPDIKNPIGRILLKPFRKEKTRADRYKVLIPENSMYGTYSKEFKNFVDKWASDNFNFEDDVTLKILPDLYNDGVGTSKIFISENSSKITSEDESERIWVANHGNDNILEKMIDDKSPRVREILIRRINDNNLKAELIMKDKDAQDLFVTYRSCFNIFIEEQNKFVKDLIKKNVNDRNFSRPILKHYERTSAGIEFYISEDYEGLCNNVCRHGNDDLVRSYLKKYPTIFNKIEICRRVPRQLEIETVKEIIDEISLMGGFAILKHEHLDVVNDKIDGKSAEDYLLSKFPTVKELVKSNNTTCEKIMDYIKQNNRELNDDEFLEFIK